MAEPKTSTRDAADSAQSAESDPSVARNAQPTREPVQQGERFVDEAQQMASQDDDGDEDEDDEDLPNDDRRASQSTSSAQQPAASATTSSSVGAVAKKKGRKKLIIINTANCRYHVVRLAALQLGWAVEDDERDDVPESLQMTDAQRQIITRHFAHRYKPELSAQVYWTDMSVLLPRVSAMKCYHRLNHFPNMHLICRKMLLFVRLSAMQEVLPSLYNFFPKSFSLKSEFRKLDDYVRSLRGKPKTFVMKPNTGCQGRGIVLTRNPIKVSKTLKDHDYTVQLYVHRPLLIDGKKFDMRVYVLLMTLERGSASIFVHEEGLVRICAEPYMKPTADNLSEVCMHLTNYSVNKESDKYEAAEGGGGGGSDGATPLPGVVFRPFMGHPLPPTLTRDDGWTGNKRSFHFLEAFVNDNVKLLQPAPPTGPPGSRSTGKDKETASDGDDDDGGGDGDAGASASSTPAVSSWIRLRRKIDRAVVLTILSAMPELRQAYSAANAMSGPRQDCRNCFELLGYDVLVTQAGHVHVLEVNHSPSLFCDTPLDTAIKSKVVSDVFRLIEPHVPDIRKLGDSAYGKHIARPVVQTSFAKAQKTVGFRRVYPLSSRLDPESEGGGECSDDDVLYKQKTMELYEEALQRSGQVFGGASKPVTPESEAKSSSLIGRAGSFSAPGKAPTQASAPRLAGAHGGVSSGLPGLPRIGVASTVRGASSSH